MANKDDYLNGYREFFEYFAETVNPNDQLPVKLGSYKLLNIEVVGGIIDWTSQYLSQKKCPPHLFSPLIKIIIDEIRKCCKKDPVNYGFNSVDNAYDPLKLMQAVMAKTNEVCLRYLDNSMLCSLPAPNNNTYFETSISTKRNRRRRMEDRHVAIHDLNTMFNIQEATPSSYYAVFDGHAGHDAAAYSAAHLHQFLAENKHFATNPDQALKDAFCKTDALFVEKCNVENLTGGSTAVVALLRPKEKSLYIAWVGDSQALLVKQGRILQCVNPHKPSREDERQRIEKAGGCVMLWGTWRVNGQLAVSRAIGDADYKPHVTAIPDVREFSLDGAEDFLIIACDGLWDFLSEDAAAQEVYYMVGENPDDTERISKQLVQLACYQGSTDNISVIVVFLRDPHLIATEAQSWAKKNGPPISTPDNMEAGLDNANNPFASPNGSLKGLDKVDADNLNLQKSNNDGLLLNLSENFKANGTDLTKDIFGAEKLNGAKKSPTDLHFGDDFGPETNVDAVDDVLSPIEKEKAFTEALVKGLKDESFPSLLNDEEKFAESLMNNNPLEATSNPFLTNRHGESEDIPTSKELNFDEFYREDREETPTPPADPVHDGGGLEVNPTESDSEDEWNYIKGDQSNPENISLQPETVVEALEPDDAMSQLNPNAAEFVPVSPTRSIPSPACRGLINDEIISESPKRPVRVDISVPSEIEFDSEVKSRPSDFDKNGHTSDDELNTTNGEPIEAILNGKSLDEIPEFQPGSTPTKPASEEFHFGPNAAPFIPELSDQAHFQTKALDQSEACSTRAEYGDDTIQTLNTSFDTECPLPSKEQTDPMSMSFYTEKGDSNPFQDDEDLNKVHVLPENLEEFLGVAGLEDKENHVSFNDTISDLPDHDPLGRPVDNDVAAVQITDLDKLSQDDEKELASPLGDEPLESVSVSSPEPVASPVPQSEHVAPSPKPELVPSTEEDLKVSSTSPEPLSTPLTPEPQGDLAEFSVQEKTDLTIDQTEVPKETLNNLEMEIPEAQGLSCSFVPSVEESPVDLVPPSCELTVAKEDLHLEPKMEMEFLPCVESQNLLGEFSTSPVPACEYAAEPETCAIPPKDLPIGGSFIGESPVDLLQELKPEEEITSSVKDDVSSPIEPLSQASFVEDSVKDDTVEVPHQTEVTEPQNVDILQDLVCPLPASQPLIQPDVVSMSEPSAPAEPTLNGLDELPTSEPSEQICIKTESIKPEYAEPEILTPSEESRGLDEPSAVSPVSNEAAPPLEQPQEPLLLNSVEPQVEEAKPAETTPVPEVSSSLPPVTSEVAAKQPPKSAEKEKKKPIGKVEPRKSTSASPKVGEVKPSARSTLASPRTAAGAKVPAKTGATKPIGLSQKTTSATSTTKPLTKPKTAPTSKPTESKAPVASTKPVPKTITRKAPTEAPATKTITRPAATTAAKASPTKTITSRPTTAPRTSASKTTTTVSPKPAGPAKPRVPLSSRTTTTTSTATSKATATTTTKSATTTITASKTLSSPKAPPAAPRPRTIAIAPKPRVPLTKTVTKSADVEKEKKESANKLAASRTTTVTRTTTSHATGRTTVAMRKTEIKPLSDRTVASKTTTTTRTTTLSKKPGEIKAVSKTKTTKIEKPKENGIAPTNVTEEINIVNNVVNQTDSESLVKDNSPIDNKLLIDTNNSLVDTTPAD